MARTQEISAAAASPSLPLAPSMRLEEPQQQVRTSPQTGHKRKRSIGDDAEQTRLTQDMLTSMKQLLKELTSEAAPETADKKEIEEITKLIKQISAKLKAVDDFRKKNPNRVIQSVPFSEVDADVLKDLGLEALPGIVEEDPFFAMLSEIFASLPPDDQATLKPLLDEPAEHFTQRLRKINNHVNQNNEAGIRLIINHLLLELVDVCNAVNLRIYLWAELSLAEKSAPVQIDYADFTTFLSGVADYGIASLASGAEDTHLSFFKGQVQSVASLRASAASRSTFWVIEAKARSVKLESCLPQAIAQCIVLAQQVFYYAPVTDLSSFCLTNGWEWIFGLVVRSSDGTIRCRRTVPLEMNLEAKGDMRSARILRALFFWATTPSHAIWQEMSKLGCVAITEGIMDNKA